MGILEYLRVDRPDCPGVVERAAPSGGARSCFEVAVTVPMSGPLSSTENAALEDTRDQRRPRSYVASDKRPFCLWLHPDNLDT